MYWLFLMFGFFLVESVVFRADAAPSTSSSTSVSSPRSTSPSSSKGKRPRSTGAVPVASQLSGTQLNRLRRPSLGETLSTQLGISSSFFGPNASRPIIRGMGGERIRILSNGLGVLDTSAANQDNAVSLDPLTIERIEIIRGSSALLYGSNAAGVVNVVTNRILEALPRRTFEGNLDIQKGSGESLLGAFKLNYGVKQGGARGAARGWTFHLDGAAKEAKDYGVPGYARTRGERVNAPLAPGVEGHDVVPNSSGRTSSATLGGSYVFDRGFAGASYSTYDSDYGAIEKRAMRIKMKQGRGDFSFGMRGLGWINSIKFKDSLSNYGHTVEGGVVGTAFKNQGNEARLELVHKPLGVWGGMFGLQGNVLDFSATAAGGKESFLPRTSSKNLAVFIREEATIGRWTPSASFRLDSGSVSANTTLVDVDPSNVGESKTDGPTVTRNFTGGNFSLAANYSFNPAHSVAGNIGYTERAPSYQELFANGSHEVRGVFERGDPALLKEKNQLLEVSYRYKRPDTVATLGIFAHEFKDYILLSPKEGGGFDPKGALGNRSLPLYQYESVNASFYGFETEAKRSFYKLLPRGILILGAKLDLVKGKNSSTGANLPRITPIRLTTSAEYKTDKLSLNMEVQESEKQTDLAPGEKALPRYEVVNVGVEVPYVPKKGAVVEFYGRINNLFNQEARSHVSLLKDIAPLPGLSFAAGVRASF